MGKDTVRRCPECGSSDLYPESGFMTGYKYHCKDCDYVGSLVIEQDLSDDDVDPDDLGEEE